jgi:hypothetical protein
MATALIKIAAIVAVALALAPVVLLALALLPLVDLRALEAAP